MTEPIIEELKKIIEEQKKEIEKLEKQLDIAVGFHRGRQIFEYDFVTMTKEDFLNYYKNNRLTLVTEEEYDKWIDDIDYDDCLAFSGSFWLKISENRNISCVVSVSIFSEREINISYD